MREDTVFSPQSPLNAPMLRFLFVPISNIVYVSDPFSSYVNLLDMVLDVLVGGRKEQQ